MKFEYKYEPCAYVLWANQQPRWKKWSTFPFWLAGQLLRFVVSFFLMVGMYVCRALGLSNAAQWQKDWFVYLADSARFEREFKILPEAPQNNMLAMARRRNGLKKKRVA